MKLEDIRAITMHLKDGDCLVVTSERHLSGEQRAQITAKLAGVIRELGVRAIPVVLDGGLDLKVVRTSDLERVDAA